VSVIVEICFSNDLLDLMLDLANLTDSNIQQAHVPLGF
jgi:hypothetical protein